MIDSGLRAVAALGLAMGMLVGASVPAAAQDPAAPPCSANEEQPSEVGVAFYQLSTASSAADKAAKQRGFRNAVAQAEKNIDKGANLPGRSFIMAKAYVMMLSDSIVQPSVTRGELGLTINPTARVDLIVTIDSLLDIVETAHPDCARELEGWRQNEIWLGILNRSIEALDAGQLDTAEHYARRTMILHEDNPYGYQILATIANRRNATDVERDMWIKTIEKAGTDTALREVKQQAFHYLGNLYATQAELATSPQEKTRLAREATKTYQEYLKNMVPGTDASLIRGNLAVAMTLSGDTLEIPSLYADMLADPSKFALADLIGAGTMASRLNRAADAVKLYTAVLQLSPFHREALYMVTASYAVESKWDSVLAYGRRLIAVDPGFPENWQLLGHGFSGLASAEKDAAKKRALTDSLVRVGTMADTMAYSVSWNSATIGSAKMELDGLVENRAKADKSFQLAIEFLDQAGNAVASKAVTVGPLKPGQTATFKAEADHPATTKIVGFRYTIK